MDSVTDKWMSEVRACKRGSVNGKRHPHKPAILIWFVENADKDNPRLLKWANSKNAWTKAIKSKGGHGSPESPLSALTKAGILDLVSETDATTSSSQVVRMTLNNINPDIGLPIEVWKEITSRSETKKRTLEYLEAELDK